MLIPPRNTLRAFRIQATCLLRRGMPTIFLHLGKFQPAKVGNFQPAETGEYSTGVDNRLANYRISRLDHQLNGSFRGIHSKWHSGRIETQISLPKGNPQSSDYSRGPG
jgi:hypothetical protein